jgi:hypothetical protein
VTRVHGYFTKIEAADPHLIPQSIWESLPPSEKALLTEAEFSCQQWAPVDQRRFRIEPESFRTELSIANVGTLRATRDCRQLCDADIRTVARDGWFWHLDNRAGREPVGPPWKA